MRLFLLPGLLMVCLPALADPPAAMPAASGELPAGSEFATGFSPDGSAEALLLQTIAGARHDIRVAAYVFSSKPVTRALLDAEQRGVQVRLVADADGSSSHGSTEKELAAGGVPVRLNDHYAIHHDKFMVIDEDTVETGSFNYTGSAASRNAENVLVIRHAPALAASYTRAWQALWDEAVDLPAPPAASGP